MKTLNREGEVKIEVNEDLDVSELIPLGLRFHSTLTANFDIDNYGTITYSHFGQNQYINLILEAKAKSGYYFSNWQINGQVALGTFEVQETDTYIKVSPIFASIPTMKIDGSIKDDDEKSLTTHYDNAYAMLIGYSILDDDIYISKQASVSDEGKYEFSEVPIGFVGVVFAGAAKHTNQAKLVYYSSQTANFNLYAGSQCTINRTSDLKTVLLKKGSYIDVEGFHDPIVFDEDIDLPYEFPPIGLPFESQVTFNPNGELIYDYKIEDANANVEMNFTFQAVGPEDKHFSHWNKNGEVFSGPYKPNEIDGDFTVEPVFEGVNPTPTPTPTPQQNPEINNTPNTFDSNTLIVGMLFATIITSGILLCYRKYYLSKNL